CARNADYGYDRVSHYYAMDYW
nr:immunoglobulin heavy chain junction region [Mus musculus]